MPSHYSDTSFAQVGLQDLAVRLRTALDSLDDQTHATSKSITGGSATDFQNMIRNGSFENWEHGSNLPPDSWILSGAGATVEREATIVQHGLYSLKLTRFGTDCNISQNIYSRYGMTYFNSRTVILGAWVYCDTAHRARLRIYDGSTTTYSSYHTGNSTWQWLTVSVTLGATPSEVSGGLQLDTSNAQAFVDGIVFSEGNVLYRYVPNRPTFNQLPKRAVMWHHKATVVSGNPIALTISASQAYSHYASQSVASSTDKFSHSFWLQAGSYILTVLGVANSAGAIATFELDGQVLGVSIDWFSASPNFNGLVAHPTPIVVTASGYHKLAGFVNGHSGAGWQLALTKYWLKQISD